MTLRRHSLGLGALLFGVLLVFSALLHHALKQEVEATAGEANRSLATAFANQNWGELEPALLLGFPTETLQNNPGLPVVDKAVRRFARGTDLVMVKIFDARGRLVYATDTALIGQDRSKSAGFLAAVRGRVATELTHRNTFSGFDGELYDRDLVSSYVPIRGEQGVEAVLELYADRTTSVDAVRQRMLTVVPWLALTLLVVWGVLHLGRRRLDARLRTLQHHEQQLQNELQVRQQEAKDALADKRAFLHGVSEELSRPLQGLAQQSQALVEQTRHDPAAPVASQLHQNLLALDRRIRDFRTVVRLEAGELTPTLGPVDVGQCVREVGAELQQAAQRQNLQSTVYVAPDAEGIVHTDGHQLGWILRILVDNALRHTPEGHIQLRLQPGAGGLQFDVIDTGTGVPPERLPQLLGTVERPTSFSSTLSAHLHDDTPRLGLGLTIAQGLTHLLGGRIQVQSTPGSGSWFSVWLPIQPTRVAG